MGLFRIFLSVSVLISHTTPIFGIHLLPGPTAVWVFFIISGFYMQMIFNVKYVSAILFYQNRFLRLYPIFILATIFSLCISGLPKVTEFGLQTRIVSLMPNFTMIGADLLFLFHYGPISGWHFTFGYPGPWAEYDGEPVRRISQSLLLKPVWSIGLEIWFYFFVPALSKLPFPGIMIVAAASFLLRILMEHQYPGITYFFFPANLGFFCLGMMSYKFYQEFLANQFSWKSSAAISVAALIIFLLGEWISGVGDDTGMFFALVAIIIPFVFHATKDFRFDRHLGDLSYPMYLFHAPVISLLVMWFAPTGLTVLITTFILSALSVVFIENPVDRWRQSRVKKGNEALCRARGECQTT